MFELDADALALGTPNRERASLEQWVELAAGKDRTKKQQALACLARYVHPEVAPRKKSAKGWRRWYDKHGARLVFVESTGFWWQLDSTLAGSKRKSRR